MRRGSRIFRRLFGSALAPSVLLIGVLLDVAQATLPPKPADYVLDEAGVFSAEARRSLSRELEQFERETSNQIVVAVIPRLPEGEALEDFTQRAAESWGVGRKGKDNGLVLFVFPDSRRMRVEVGYGLEGAVPDALANNIINREMVPRFRAGDMAGGIRQGAEALMAASRGEYRGSGQTISEEAGAEGFDWAPVIFFIVFATIVVISVRRNMERGGRVYSPGGGSTVWFPSGGTGLGGGGGFSGSGGFSGGGGGFGGGGASGSW